MPTARDFDLDRPKWATQSRLHFTERVVLECERIRYQQLDALVANYNETGRTPFQIPVPDEEFLANFSHPIIRKAMIAAEFKKAGPTGVYNLMKKAMVAAQSQDHQLRQRLIDVGLLTQSTPEVSALEPSTAELSLGLGGLGG